jgi:ATP diphosphatase
VPRNLPALSRAQAIQKKAAKVGFDWPSVEGVLDKIEEEFGELRAAVASDNDAAISEEVGDLLFSVVNLSRFRKVQADEALRATIRKFETRFAAIEAALAAKGKRPQDCTLAELDALWNRAKG